MSAITKLVQLIALIALIQPCTCSWNAYITNMIGQSKDTSGVAQTDKGALMSKAYGSLYTSGSNSITLQGTEGSVLSTAFRSGDFTTLQPSFSVGGLSYGFLRVVDDKIVLGNSITNGAITLEATGTVIVIGHTPVGKQQGNTNKAVNVIAEYLRSLGY